MATTDNSILHRFYDGISLPSKRFSGIVGDAKHAAQGGYHIGRNFVPRSDYSAGQGGRNSSSRDKNGDGNASCAIDVSFNTADMITATKRLVAAMNSGALVGVREFNGTLDGRSTINRDAVLGWKQNYTPDATHLWHIHIGFFRDTAQDWDVLSRVVSVINGEPVKTDTNTSGPADQIITSLEDDMPLWIKRPQGRAEVFAGNTMGKWWIQDENTLADLVSRLNVAGIKDPDTKAAYTTTVEEVANVNWLGPTIGKDPFAQ